MDKVNMILEVAEELGIKKDFDSLIAEGFKYINDDWTDEENRENLMVNL